LRVLLLADSCTQAGLLGSLFRPLVVMSLACTQPRPRVRFCGRGHFQLYRPAVRVRILPWCRSGSAIGQHWIAGHAGGDDAGGNDIWSMRRHISLPGVSTRVSPVMQGLEAPDRARLRTGVPLVNGVIVLHARIGASRPPPPRQAAS